MNKDFFNGKKVLITGHTGFKGTWLTLILKKLGACICGYSLPVEADCFYSKVGLTIDSHNEGDITNTELLMSVIKEFKPEIVIHLASHSSLNHSYEIPEYILKTNIMGTVSLFECIRKVNTVKAVLIVTSDKCYKNNESDIAYKEDCYLGAQDPYSTSKACQDMIAECYRNSYYKSITGVWGQSVAIATARASNVIGPGDYNTTRLIPYILDCFTNNQQAFIRNPDAIRPWQSIFDVLEGYLLLVEKLYLNCNINNNFCNAYNFGPDEKGFIKVSDAIKKFSFLFNNASYEIINVTNNNETKILRLDINKAKNELNWIPQVSFETMLDVLFQFSEREKSGERLEDICYDYINKYLLEEENYER